MDLDYLEALERIIELEEENVRLRGLNNNAQAKLLYILGRVELPPQVEDDYNDVLKMLAEGREW